MNVQIPVKWLQELLALCGPEDHELRERVIVSITAMDEQAARAVVLPEPVGEVGRGFAMVWAGTGPISPICQKWGINVGTKLYTEQQVRALLADARDALDSRAIVEKLPRYTYGYKSDEWGMGNHLQSYQDPEGKFLMRDEVIAAIAAAKGNEK